MKSDLLAWHNLAWFDPLFWDDPEIAGWLQHRTFCPDFLRAIAPAFDGAISCCILPFNIDA